VTLRKEKHIEKVFLKPKERKKETVYLIQVDVLWIMSLNVIFHTSRKMILFRKRGISTEP